jgi:hypothetical protein
MTVVSPLTTVLAWRAGQPFRREAPVHLIQGGRGFEAIVDIGAKRVRSWTEVPNRQYITSIGERAPEGDRLRSDHRSRNRTRIPFSDEIRTTRRLDPEPIDGD